MESWLQELFGWLPGGQSYYALIFVIALLESVVLIGLIVPGSVLTVFAGFLAAHGKGDLLWLMPVAAAGAFWGDLLSYWLGARLGESLLQSRPLRRRQNLVQKAELFFASHGGKSIFFGRFLGPLRGLIPFVAGSSKMRPFGFTAYALISGLLWGLAYPGLGYLGGASWQRVQQLSGRLSLLVASLLALLVINSLFWNRLAPRIARRGFELWGKVGLRWQGLLQTPTMAAFVGRYPRLWNFLADRFSLHHGTGLYLTTGFFASTLFAILFVVLVRGIRLQPLFVNIDQWTYQAVQYLQHPITDKFFIVVTYLGNLPVVLMLAALVLLWLILNNRDFSAVILVAGTFGGELMVVLLKQILKRSRPEPFFPELLPDSFSLPSAHAFVALVFYGLVVYMLLDTINNWQDRFSLVLGGSFMALLIGFSRVYLGVHWLSDVLAGYLLAAIWLTFLITASEIRRRYAGEFPWRQDGFALNISQTARATIMTAAAVLSLGGVVAYLVAKMGNW